MATASSDSSASAPASATTPSEGDAPASVGAGGPEIAFFDVETSVPQRAGQGYALLEFGAILVCPRRLVEVASYATLVRPADPASAVSAASVRCNGITRDAVSGAPPFRDVADAVYDLLNGRVWAGHNIVRFDSARIREAFAEIGRPPPEPKGLIDTLPLLTQRFGRRAGDMKMASLANYFGLGKQRHRSLDDVRMNLEVLKYCATVLFLEASLPEVLTVQNLVERAITRSQANGAASPEVPKPEANSSPDSSKRQRTVCPADGALPEGGNQGTSDPSTSRGVELVPHIEEMKLDTTTQMDASSSGYSEFLELDDISTECIKISVAPLHQFGWRSAIQHKDSPLQLCCAGLKVQFGVSTKFLDNAGRPKLNIVVDIPENLSKVLEFCDDLARRSSQESGSTSEWRPMVKKYGYVNRPTVRLNIPTIVSGDSAIYSTDICQKEPGGNIQKLVFSNVDASELDSLLVRGSKVDAFFSLEIYDYQQNAGIRLVAKRLLVHSK
ncbi:Protein NEN1 [Dichanthelium oligosanthes]|uniref:Protein NEN1 n=1 Tax=Dichanthelium oligosanthes TaxID=888268 RepID=A0A1E5VV17_9POAL|nr:Protein NEN1 [Dichanthelium oligosanthes]